MEASSNRCVCNLIRSREGKGFSGSAVFCRLRVTSGQLGRGPGLVDYIWPEPDAGMRTMMIMKHEAIVM